MAESDLTERLDVSGLSVATRGRKIIHDLEFSLKAGELVALVGASGAGKSLSARACLGLLPPEAWPIAGTVTVTRATGQTVWSVTDEHPPIAKLRGRFFGWLPQDSRASLNPVWSLGRQLARALRQGGHEYHDTACHNLLIQAGFSDPTPLMSAIGSHLSGGQAQRAALALALAGKPRLLFADEPTTGLDSTVQAAVMSHLRHLVDGGMGLLFITHDLALVERHADRVLILDQGRVVESLGRGLIGQAKSSAGQCLLKGMAELQTLLPPERIGRKVFSGRSLRVRFRHGPPWARQETNALDGVDIDLFLGESVGLVGESGSGKTTLARAIAGQVPVEGQVERPQGGPGPQHVQLLFQEPSAHLDPNWTVHDLLLESTQVAQNFSRPPTDLRTVLQRVGLFDRATLRSGALSGGERRRLGIARVSVMQAPLVLADEPTAGLDAAKKAEVTAMLQDLRGAGCLLLITHDMAVVRHATHRVLVMLRGRIVESFATSQMGKLNHHPYTQQLLAAAGLVDEPVSPPTPPATSGCSYAPACRERLPTCSFVPELRSCAPDHKIACHLRSPNPDLAEHRGP